MIQCHTIYLGIIAFLIIIVVFTSAKAIRAQRIMSDIENDIRSNIRSSMPRKNKESLRNLTAEDILKPRTFDQYKKEIDSMIDRAATLEEFGKKTQLAEACKKALIGGKRLRSIILLEVARATSIVKEDLMPVDAGEVALFIEYLHTASLIIDDLPAFDNDSVRRGRPTLHVEMGPAIAQMAALSFIAGAFQNVCRQLDWIRDNCPEIKNVDRIGTRIVNEVSHAIGAMGAAGGQYMDVSSIEHIEKEHGPDAISDIIYRKTATFFEIATVVGWIIAGGNSENISVLRDIGRQIGIAFQIADDIGDMEQDTLRGTQGKPSWNFANEYGKDVALREVERNLKGARYLLKQIDCWTPLWDEIYVQVRKMTESTD
jgi:geranylgeranyl diphosphate synthase type II